MCTKRCLLYCKKETGKSVLYKKSKGLLRHGSASAPAEGSALWWIKWLAHYSWDYDFLQYDFHEQLGDCVVAPCQQGSTSKNLSPYYKPQNMVIFKE